VDVEERVYTQAEVDELKSTAYQEGYSRRDESAQSEIIRRADDSAKERVILLDAISNLSKFVGARH